MACEINPITIRNGVVNEITNTLLTSGQYQEQNGVIVDVLQDEVTRLPTESESGRTELIKQATNVLQGQEGDQEDSQIIQTQEELLERWAKENSRWVEDEDTLGELIGRGEEATVYRKGNNVFKVLNYTYSPSPLSILDRMAITNSVVPGSVKVDLEGYGRFEGEFRTIVKQPFIQGTEVTDRDTIRTFMERSGWFYEGGDDYSTPEYVVKDLRADNVILNESDELQLIDVAATLNTEEEDYDGEMQYNNISNRSVINGINESYGYSVVSQENGIVSINPPDELISEYVSTYNSDEEADKIIATALQVTAPTIITAPQRMKVLHILNKLGVSVDAGNVAGRYENVDAVALPLQALVSHTEGNEEKLPEEAFHIAVEILSVNHPGLLNKMLSQITSLPIYQEVYNQYSSVYGGNILKIKKEAIAKQLASQLEQPEVVLSWWERVKSFLRGLFGDTGVDLAPFKDALEVITRGNIGTVRNTLLKSEKYLRRQNISEDNIREIIRLANSELTDDMLRMRIEQIVPEEVFYSLSDVTKTTYDKLNKAGQTATTSVLRKLTDLFTELFGSNTSKQFTEAIEQFKNQKDDIVHQDLNNILRRYVNQDGTIRQTPLPYQNSSLPKEQYDKLEVLVADHLGYFPEAKVLHNKDFSSDTSTNIDLVIVDREGVTHTFNFFTTPQPYVTQDIKKGLDLIASENRKILKDGYSVSNQGQNRVVLVPLNNNNILDPVEGEFDKFVSTVDKTGSSQIDVLIANLKKLSGRNRNTNADNRLFSQIAKAIKGIQTKSDIQSTVNVVYNIARRGNKIAEDYQDFKKSKPSEEQISDYANKLDNILTLISAFEPIYSALQQASEENQVLFGAIRDKLPLLSNATSSLHETKVDLESVNRDFTEVYTANPNGEQNINSIERSVRKLTRNFNKFSDSVTRATRTLYSIVSRVNRATEIEVSEEGRKLQKIKEAYDKIADKKNYLSKIAQKTKDGKYIHRLIEQYDKGKFTEGLKKAIAENDTEWVRKNIRYEEYQRWFRDTRDEVFADFESNTFHSDPKENKIIVDARKQEWLDKYDITKNVSDRNIKLTQYINDNFLSEEYKQLQKNKAAFDLWSYIRGMNERAYKAGVLSREQAETLIPSVKKSLIERAITGTKLRGSTNLLESLLSPEDYAAETNINPETGVAEEKLPFYFTRDLSIVGKDGERDYSGVSQDIFKLLPTYVHQTVFAERIRPQEARIRLLGVIEKNKRTRMVNAFGDVDTEGGSKIDDTNFNYYWDFVRMSVYGHRDLDGNFDTRIVSLSSKTIDKINKTFGSKIPTDNKSVNLTVRNAVKIANKMFQMKVLGLNVAIPIANFFGSNFQTYINSGTEFTRKDLMNNQIKAFQSGWTTAEKNTYAGLGDYFQIFTDKGNTERLTRQLSQSALTKLEIPELLMSLQSESEIPIQMMIAGAMFDTTMVQNGELVNIRKFVKDKYPDYYDRTATERKALDKRIEDEIAQLQNTRALSKIAKFENKQLVIPGIDRQSTTVYDFVNRLQAHTKRATGGGNREDMRLINGTILGSSLMVFKSWMPRLITNRVSGLKYSKGLQAYEMGRWNAIGNILGEKWYKDWRNLYDVYVMNDRGVSRLKEVYDQHKAEYEERTGEVLNMTQKEYIELQQRLIRNSMKDALIAGSLLGLWGLIGSMQPPEEDESNGIYNFVYNMSERFQKELTFYYSPSEWFNVVDGSLFPALGTVKEMGTVVKEVGKTVNYLVTDNEKLKKKTHLFKAVTRPVPILNQSGLFLQLFYEDFAKELGYKDLTPNEQ